MVHCHPTVMIHQVVQPLPAQYATQPWAPQHFVVLAKIQHHETSECQGKAPLPLLVALVLSKERVFVGSELTNKVGA